jgi:hypothetical protein
MPSKSAKYRSQALAKAKRSLGKFSGELASPILVSDWPGLASPMFLERHIAEQRTAKLEILLAHYGIEPNDKNRWTKLSRCLAADLVPGMIAIKVPAKKFPAGTNREWTLKRYSDLVREVDAILATGVPKIYAATMQLAQEQPNKWGRYGGDSLKTRYHEGKQLLKEMAKRQAAAARPLWAFTKDATS